jgi:hypothetical protein
MNQPFHSQGRRKFLLSSATLIVSSLFLTTKAFASKVSSLTAKPRLGINLAGIADWNTEQPFLNFFHMSRDWVSQGATGGWGNGPKLDLDAHGWVKSLAPGCRATRIICSLEGGEYPSGEYTILYDGEGDLKMSSGVGQIVDKSPGRMVALVNSKKGMFSIDLVKTNPKNYMRNIRVIVPGFEKIYAENPWHPDFLKRWSGIACLRFMDFMATNNSTQVNWQDRPKPEDAGYTSRGVPVEVLVDLANRLNTDGWFCVPHQANDEYIKSLATYTKSHLKPNLRAWFEYSNEVWNGMFKQSQYAAQMGQKMGLADKPWEASWYFTSHRSAQMFDSLDAVYAGESNRYVKVLASQAASSFISEQLLMYKEIAKKTDVLAIAPYVSMNVTTDDKQALSVNKVAGWNLNQLFDYLNKTAIPESTKWIQDTKKVADKFGVQMVGYEGGQHLVGVFGAENNEDLNKLMDAANSDPRMGEVYTKSLTDWQQAGGDLMCTFDSMARWSKWGRWGLLRDNQEDPKKSPKFTAAINWAIKQGQKMTY